MWNMEYIARIITEDPDVFDNDDTYYLELALVGPKSRGSSRRFGAYVLPHSLAMLNWDLIDNPEYLDRCVVYDITNDQVAPQILQELQQVFLSEKADFAELAIKYDDRSSHEEHKSYYGGEVVPNAPTHNEFLHEIDFNSAYLIINNRTMKIPDNYGYKVFQEFFD